MTILLNFHLNLKIRNKIKNQIVLFVFNFKQNHKIYFFNVCVA